VQYAGEEITSTLVLTGTLRASTLEAPIGPGSAGCSAGDFGLYLGLSMEIL
jgi:hypothetical protein